MELRDSWRRGHISIVWKHSSFSWRQEILTWKEQLSIAESHTGWKVWLRNGPFAFNCVHWFRNKDLNTTYKPLASNWSFYRSHHPCIHGSSITTQPVQRRLTRCYQLDIDLETVYCTRTYKAPNIRPIYLHLGNTYSRMYSLYFSGITRLLHDIPCCIKFYFGKKNVAPSQNFSSGWTRSGSTMIRPWWTMCTVF